MSQANPSRYVVIGNPIAHSKSPLIHADFAQQVGLNIQYRALSSPLDGFEQCVQALVAAGVAGANVTVPFKQQAFALANQASDSVQFAQAANTLKFLPDGSIVAHNTDGAGLCNDLAHLLALHKLRLDNCHVLMIGAGGAASGCISAFKQASVRGLTILNRTPDKAQELAKRAHSIGLPAKAGGLNEPAHNSLAAGQVWVVVNASSSSLGGDVPHIDPQWYQHAVLAYDMMYAPAQSAAMPTAFMAHVDQITQGRVKTVDGLGMLVHQAALAFEMWTHFKPDANLTLQRMRFPTEHHNG